MKKILLLILPLVFSVFAANAKGDEHATTGIKFNEGTPWADVLKKAAKEKKLVFVDIYTTWCGPCKLLKKNTFPDEALGKYFNANYVSVAIDAEQGEGIKLAEKFGIQGYPTLLVVDKDGNEVARTMGYMPAEQLLDFGKTTRNKKK